MSTFTQHGIEAIFNRCNPSFKINLTPVSPSIQNQIATDNKQSSSTYLIGINETQRILNKLNTYYDTYDHMSNTSISENDANYVWSNKQHIISMNLKIYHVNALFIKDTYNPDISKIYFIEILDQDNTLDNIGYLKSFTIQQLQNQNTCTNIKNTSGIKVDESLRQTKLKKKKKGD